MKEAVIFDGRNCYSLIEAERSGVEYYSVGRKTITLSKDKLASMENHI